MADWSYNVGRQTDAWPGSAMPAVPPGTDDPLALRSLVDSTFLDLRCLGRNRVYVFICVRKREKVCAFVCSDSGPFETGCGIFWSCQGTFSLRCCSLL